MPTMEHVTNQRVLQALYAEITSNTTTTGAIFDTADYDAGIYFAMAAPAWVDGAYALKIEHGDDAALADAADVPADSLVFATMPSLSAAMTDGDAMPRQGIFGTKRYVRASIVSTGVTSGATINVVIVKDAEFLPTDQDL